MEDIRRLSETYKSYNKASDELIEKLFLDEDAQRRVIRRGEHFNSLVYDLIVAVEERIWKLCMMQKSPLPTTCAAEPKKWIRFTFGAQVKP